MDSSIPLLERFSNGSVIISYYGTADRSFLLLSQLNRGSRNMLDENYEGYLNGTTRTTISLKDLKHNQNKNLLLLPSDLFKFYLELEEESDIDTFLIGIKRISDGVGYYFNDHYLHSSHWFTKIKLNIKLVKKIYPSLELLESIEVIERSISEENRLSIKKCKLIDKFALSIKFSNGISYK